MIRRGGIFHGFGADAAADPSAFYYAPCINMATAAFPSDPVKANALMSECYTKVPTSDMGQACLANGAVGTPAYTECYAKSQAFGSAHCAARQAIIGPMTNDQIAECTKSWMAGKVYNKPGMVTTGGSESSILGLTYMQWALIAAGVLVLAGLSGAFAAKKSRRGGSWSEAVANRRRRRGRKARRNGRRSYRRSRRY